jgi:alpha-glucosidase (family GH31 glycosyl hydrolase)
MQPPLRELVVEVPPEEYWWGGAVNDGPEAPYTACSGFERSLFGNTEGNQAQALLLSSQGRYVYSEQPFRFAFREGRLVVSGADDVSLDTPGSTLRAAYLAAQARHFPASGQLVDPCLFTQAQFNTWIELTYNQNQKDIEAYAEAAVSHGYSPGLLMLDDTWQEAYGVWRFHPGRFPEPRRMVDRLHALGFKVMLWVVPYVSADSTAYRALERTGGLILQAQSPTLSSTRARPAMFRWWNGVSAALDFTHPEALKWLEAELGRLQGDYGIDGFKFDAGDADLCRQCLTGEPSFFSPSDGNDQSERYARFGVRYPLNEFRACWRAAGLPLAQRLKDKNHTWEALRTLIPCGLSQGLLGYAFTCPDMIGGGEFHSFEAAGQIDGELVVRSAQASALFPMMQFSAAPWRVLNQEHQAYCLQAAKLHGELGEEILELAKVAALTGEPILRHLEYTFAHQGFSSVNDQFLLGDEILVAPVLAPGLRERRVSFPTGKWRSPEGQLFTGPTTQVVSAPLDKLPWFRRA